MEKRELPAGWWWTRLGNVGHFESGGTPSKEKSEFWGGTIPFVTGADITDFWISSKHARAFLTKAGTQSGKTALCYKGTVLFVTRTRVGRIGIAAETVAASQDLSPYICGSELIPEYVCRYLQSISDYLLANCRGATIQGLTREFVSNIEIPLAPLTEQQRIAAILTDQLAAVERARKASEARLEAARALPAAYLREVFESEKAKGWRWVQLAEVCEEKTGICDPSNEPNKPFRYVDISSVDNLTKRIIEPKTLLGKDAPGRARQIIHTGDIIVSTTRPNLNAVALVPPELDDQICSTGFCVLRPKKNLHRDYLFAFVQTPAFTKNLSDLVKGALYPAVTDKQVRTQFIPLPPLAEQQRIAAILTDQLAAVERARKAAEEQLKAINELPASLLRQAFTGNL